METKKTVLSADDRRLLAEASRGNADRLPELRALLGREAELAAGLGDLAAHAEMSWSVRAGRGDMAVAESVRLAAARRRDELALPGDGPVERLAVARVVACALQADYFETREARAAEEGRATPEQRYLGGRVALAQRMLRDALKSLADLRRLLPKPAVPAPTGRPAGKSASGRRRRVSNRPRAGAPTVRC